MSLLSSDTPAIQRPCVQSKAGCAKSTRLCARYPTCPSIPHLKSRLTYELNQSASIGRSYACEAMYRTSHGLHAPPDDRDHGAYPSREVIAYNGAYLSREVTLPTRCVQSGFQHSLYHGERDVGALERARIHLPLRRAER